MTRRAKIRIAVGLGVMLLMVVAMAWDAVKQVKLRPSVACTRIACTPVHPCCNSCWHDGWETQGLVGRRAQGLFRSLPLFPADGCGQIGASIRAWGYDSGSYFFVLYFTVEQGSTPGP